MKELDVRTVVYLPPEEAFELIRDFPGYANYSTYLKTVHQEGDGSVGTRYDLVLAWWKLGYTARSRVTAIEPPERIDWTLVDGLDAQGSWFVEPAPEKLDDPDSIPDEVVDPEHATRIILHVEYDPESARDASIDLPMLVSMDWVIGKVTPLAEREGKRVVKRIAADLEGQSRPVELTIENNSR